VFDPWEQYPDGIRDPNTFVMGKLGGAEVDARQGVRVPPVRVRAGDPDHRCARRVPRARRSDRRHGDQALQDGGTCLNPLESPADRHELLRAVAQAVLRRPLSDREPALLNTALDDIVRAQSIPTLPRHQRAHVPHRRDGGELATTPRRLAAEPRNVALALQPLRSRTATCAACSTDRPQPDWTSPPA